MSFWLYWNFGSCNYGDHSCGIERFDTEKQLDKKLEELRAVDGGESGHPEYVLIKGDQLKKPNRKQL